MTSGQPPHPRFAIVNDSDAPNKTMVAQYIDGLGYCYMDRHGENKYKRRYDGMQARRPTSMEDFGFEVEALEFQVNFQRTGPSRAVYNDGRPREWQDRNVKFALPFVQIYVSALPTEDEIEESITHKKDYIDDFLNGPPGVEP